MPKTREQLEKDVNSLLRFLYTALEELAALDATAALHPYQLHERKRLVRRKVWELHAEYIKAGAAPETSDGNS